MGDRSRDSSRWLTEDGGKPCDALLVSLGGAGDLAESAELLERRDELNVGVSGLDGLVGQLAKRASGAP